MSRARYASLLARRRRQARRRRRARAGLLLAASFVAGLVAAGPLADAQRRLAAMEALPPVAAGPAPSREVAPEPPAPAAPPEALALLPPPARAGVAAWPDLLAEPPRDRLVERVRLTAPAEGATRARGPLEIEYTLDPALSGSVADVLRQGRVELAHVIVMDPSDGRLLAYASTEPRSFPATRAYPTASLMKVVTAAAALQHAPQATQRPCRYRGSPYFLARTLLDPPAAGHSSTFEHALAISNNQCFAQLAVNDLGMPVVVDQMEQLGLLDPPGPGHQPGEVDPVKNRLDLGKLGSGLAGSRISPLAAVRLAAALVDGRVPTPRWIERVRDANGTELLLPPPAPPRPALAPSVTRELRSMMVETTVRGTARRAFRGRDGRPLLDPVPVAGKTGSLNGKDPDGHYEWFIGVAPADAPRIAIATLVVNRGTWRLTASQVAAEVLKAVFCGAGGSCRPDPVGSTLAGAAPASPALSGRGAEASEAVRAVALRADRR